MKSISWTPIETETPDLARGYPFYDLDFYGHKLLVVYSVAPRPEGEPLPELDTAATGEGGELVSALLEAADDLDLDVRIMDSDEWDHGEAKGICTSRDPMSMQPLVEVLNRSNEADFATTLIHEYAHARCHFDIDDRDERAKREVEAETVAYVVGRYFGLDTSNSAFYLAAWKSDDTEVIQERLQRISATAAEIIGVLARRET